MSEERSPRVVEARKAMGTRFEIVLPGTNERALRGAAEEALDEIDRLEAQLTKFDSRSEISGINAHAAREVVRVEPRLFALLQTALEISEATEGAFDPTVAPLMQAWGFVGGGGRLPDPEDVERAREITGWHQVGLDAEDYTLWFGREGVSLDLGAIGKGYAIDRAIELLRDAGITAALIHGGTSTVYGLGAPQLPTGHHDTAPDASVGEGEDGPEATGDGWRVAIRDPGGPEGSSLADVLLRDRALSVSGSHGKAFREGDRLYGHVLDPRTGEPTRAALLAAVGHPSATVTDALSTALLVLGPEALPELTERFPEADLLVVTSEDGRATLHPAGPNAWQLRPNAI